MITKTISNIVIVTMVTNCHAKHTHTYREKEKIIYYANLNGFNKQSMNSFYFFLICHEVDEKSKPNNLFPLMIIRSQDKKYP